MIAPRTAPPRELATKEPAIVAIAGHLQLVGLLVIAIALREIEVSGGRPLVYGALLAGTVTLAAASFLRRRWKQATRAALRVRGAMKMAPTRATADPIPAGGRLSRDESLPHPLAERAGGGRHAGALRSPGFGRITKEENGPTIGIDSRQRGKDKTCEAGG